MEKTEIIENDIQNKIFNQTENLNSNFEEVEKIDCEKSNEDVKSEIAENFEKTDENTISSEENQQIEVDDGNKEIDVFEKSVKKDEGIVIFGELFKFVREKGLKFLISEMRKIKKVSVLENSVEIIFDELPDVMVQNHLKNVFDEFFGKKNLDYKLKGNNNLDDIEFEINRINELFGGKLIVKDE